VLIPLNFIKINENRSVKVFRVTKKNGHTDINIA